MIPEDCWEDHLQRRERLSEEYDSGLDFVDTEEEESEDESEQ